MHCISPGQRLLLISSGQNQAEWEVWTAIWIVSLLLGGYTDCSRAEGGNHLQQSMREARGNTALWHTGNTQACASYWRTGEAEEMGLLGSVMEKETEERTWEWTGTSPGPEDKFYLCGKSGSSASLTHSPRTETWHVCKQAEQFLVLEVPFFHWEVNLLKCNKIRSIVQKLSMETCLQDCFHICQED